VKNGCHDKPIPRWLYEFVDEPVAKITTAPMYFTRGYTFHTFTHGSKRSTANFGIQVQGETDFYGVLQQIIEITYPGTINLKCVLFKCDWYDPTSGRGVRKNNLGVIDVNANRRYAKFEPYCLASQADQVCFLPYPRIRERRERWLSVIKVNPRGRIIVGEIADVAMQAERVAEMSVPTESTENILHIDQITKKQKSLLMIPPKGLFQKNTSLMLKLKKMTSQMMRLKIETMKMYLKMNLIRQNFTFMLYCLVFEFFLKKNITRCDGIATKLRRNCKIPSQLPLKFATDLHGHPRNSVATL